MPSMLGQQYETGFGGEIAPTKPVKLTQGVRDALWETSKAVPYVGMVPSAIDAYSQYRAGNALGVADNAVSVFPGYTGGKLLVAEGVRHLLPVVRQGMDLATGLRLNAKTLGNAAQVKSVGDAGYAWGSVGR